MEIIRRRLSLPLWRGLKKTNDHAEPTQWNKKTTQKPTTYSLVFRTDCLHLSCNSSHVNRFLLVVVASFKLLNMFCIIIFTHNIPLDKIFSLTCIAQLFSQILFDSLPWWKLQPWKNLGIVLSVWGCCFQLTMHIANFWIFKTGHKKDVHVL